MQRRFLIAIWGIETRYGRVTGTTPVFQALATLAWEPRRAAFFSGKPVVNTALAGRLQ